MCTNICENTLVHANNTNSKLINNLIYNEQEKKSARTDAKKVMRGVIRSIISYVKQFYYLYNHINETFLASNVYK